VHAPNWGHDVAGEIRVLANHRTESATLRLTPADLGPIEVQIRFDGDAASVQLAASHPETRAALESALPRLREMFAGHGLQLADAGVSGQRQHGGRDDAPATPSRPALANATPNTRTIASVAIGQIDDYA
jgi:flagellar hook-length control protein FliK